MLVRSKLVGGAFHTLRAGETIVPLDLACSVVKPLLPTQLTQASLACYGLGVFASLKLRLDPRKEQDAWLATLLHWEESAKG